MGSLNVLSIQEDTGTNELGKDSHSPVDLEIHQNTFPPSELYFKFPANRLKFHCYGYLWDG